MRVFDHSMLRSFFVPILAMLAAGHSTAQFTLQVELTRPDDGGELYIALCNGRTAYEEVKGCHERRRAVDAPVVEIVFPDLPPGEYAVKALHDLNGNKEMDFSIVGMPKEPYGFSNNVMGMFGPPDFDDAKIKVGNAPATARMRMRN